MNKKKLSCVIFTSYFIFCFFILLFFFKYWIVACIQFIFGFLFIFTYNSKVEIKEYPKSLEFKQIEIEWLKKIKNKVPYKVIANDSCISEGYFKSKIKLLYNKLNVKNKTEFLDRYYDKSIEEIVSMLSSAE